METNGQQPASQANPEHYVNQSVDLSLAQYAEHAWRVIPPYWPLKNLVACNPLRGFESFPFEQALTHAKSYFENREFPPELESINRQTIKWCEAYFDEGHATISMPNRERGLFAAWKILLPFDKQLHNGEAEQIAWIEKLSDDPNEVVVASLTRLGIRDADRETFLTLMLTTLSGWAAYIVYRTEWALSHEAHVSPITKEDYLALRLVITALLWPDAGHLINWHRDALKQAIRETNPISKILQDEQNYRDTFLKAIEDQSVTGSPDNSTPDVQMLFCIDTRSEPFRRRLESLGNYETFGCAGFFNLVANIHNDVTGEIYRSCPVLINPDKTVTYHPTDSDKMKKRLLKSQRWVFSIKRFYQSLKYSFGSSFALFETMGIFSGTWMGIKNFLPRMSMHLKRLSTIERRSHQATVTLTELSEGEQLATAESLLRSIGLTQLFANIIVIAGHASATQNNTFATSLDCGACAGHTGTANAVVMAEILNRQTIRDALAKKSIHIPADTVFVAATHHTTTDQVSIHKSGTTTRKYDNRIKAFERVLLKAAKRTAQWRCEQMNIKKRSLKQLIYRSHDWAQVRPEWGLARNAAFVIGPRQLTRSIDLEGRSFLHSYEWEGDPDTSILQAILVGPMVVTQWINNQYLFSTLNNIVYGSGSKITHNIVAKIGVMQGNASDLMHGLPLQSVYQTDDQPYHVPQRLLVVIHAPKSHIEKTFAEGSYPKQLVKNGWVQLACLDPSDGKAHMLNRNMTWQD